MNKFALTRAKDYEHAAMLVATGGGGGKFSLPVLKAGGMDVVDHLKEGLIEPDLLIDIKRARLNAGGGGANEPVSLVKQDPAGDRPATQPKTDGDRRGTQDRATQEIRIEAWATLADIAASSIVNEHAPVVARAVEFAATPQVRNVATAAGNLLQRPRCWYYRNEQFNCLKKGGSTCFAVEGENRYHAILGGGPCHIVHPSNLAPALMVCEGTMHLIGSKRSSIPISDLYHLPDKGIKTEHNLEPGEVITHITLRSQPMSGFNAVKEKQSFDWPVALACVMLRLSGSKIEAASVVAGAVAPIPWHLPKVEQALIGIDVTDDAAVRNAAGLAAEGARPMTDNAYKVRLLPVVVHRAILRAAGLNAEGIA